jgi:hypothetical protein
MDPPNPNVSIPRRRLSLLHGELSYQAERLRKQARSLALAALAAEAEGCRDGFRQALTREALNAAELAEALCGPLRLTAAALGLAAPDDPPPPSLEDRP